MDYLEKFMSECINSGHSSVVEIAQKAKERIKYIEIEYQKVENLKKEEKTLKSLLKQLGADTSQVSQSVQSDLKLEDLPEEIKILFISIIDLIEDCGESSSKEIIETISTLDNSRNVLLALKYLIDSKILFRNDSTRKISKGVLWQEKEKNLSIINLKN